jgi:Fe-S cluster assembly scaffold protein SufB
MLFYLLSRGIDRKTAQSLLHVGIHRGRRVAD